MPSRREVAGPRPRKPEQWTPPVPSRMTHRQRMRRSRMQRPQAARLPSHRTSPCRRQVPDRMTQRPLLPRSQDCRPEHPCHLFIFPTARRSRRAMIQAAKSSRHRGTPVPAGMRGRRPTPPRSAGRRFTIFPATRQLARERERHPRHPSITMTGPAATSRIGRRRSTCPRRTTRRQRTCCRRWSRQRWHRTLPIRSWPRLPAPPPKPDRQRRLPPYPPWMRPAHRHRWARPC